MPTTRDLWWVQWLATLLAGAVAATALWLVTGEPALSAAGFVLVAIAQDARGRTCARRVLPSGR